MKKFQSFFEEQRQYLMFFDEKIRFGQQYQLHFIFVLLLDDAKLAKYNVKKKFQVVFSSSGST